MFSLQTVHMCTVCREKLTVLFVLIEECAFSWQINGGRWYKICTEWTT